VFYTFRQEKERSSYSRFPCAAVLSVAGFFDLSMVFPLGSGFILRVIPKRPERGIQHFRELTAGILSYVMGIRNVEVYDEQAAQGPRYAGQ